MTEGARQRAYLEAMGIPVWQRREQPQGRAEPEEAVSPVREATPPVSDTVSGEAPIAGLDWAALEARVRDCRRCPLHEGRSREVFGVGNPQADWMLIGEAPGAEEDRQGEPFVGRAGQLLDAMLAAVGQSRSSVYIANIIKSRPPRNRDPQPEEIEACLPYLRRQIELVSPRLVMLVGRVSAQTLLESSAPVGRLRGQLHRLPGFGIPAIVSYHPAYLLRSPLEKRKAWSDLRLAMNALREASTEADA